MGAGFMGMMFQVKRTGYYVRERAGGITLRFVPIDKWHIGVDGKLTVVEWGFSSPEEAKNRANTMNVEAGVLWWVPEFHEVMLAAFQKELDEHGHTNICNI